MGGLCNIKDYSRRAAKIAEKNKRKVTKFNHGKTRIRSEVKYKRKKATNRTHAKPRRMQRKEKKNFGHRFSQIDTDDRGKKTEMNNKI